MTRDEITEAFDPQTAQEPSPTKLYAMVRYPTRMALLGLPNDPEALYEKLKDHSWEGFVLDHVPRLEAPR